VIDDADKRISSHLVLDILNDNGSLEHRSCY
jgi:hypothetical protein